MADALAVWAVEHGAVGASLGVGIGRRDVDLFRVACEDVALYALGELGAELGGGALAGEFEVGRDVGGVTEDVAGEDHLPDMFVRDIEME